MLRDSESKQEELIARYDRAMEDAEREASYEQPRPNENFDRFKQRLVNIFMNRLRKVEPSYWDSVKETVSSVFGRLRTRQSVADAFHDAARAASRRAQALPDLPGENWDEKRQRLVREYEKALETAEENLDYLDQALEDATETGHLEPNLENEYKLKVMYSNAALRALHVIESLKRTSGGFEDLKHRAAADFEDALHRAEETADLTLRRTKLSDRIKQQLMALFSRSPVVGTQRSEL